MYIPTILHPIAPCLWNATIHINDNTNTVRRWVTGLASQSSYWKIICLWFLGNTKLQHRTQNLKPQSLVQDVQTIPKNIPSLALISPNSSSTSTQYFNSTYLICLVKDQTGSRPETISWQRTGFPASAVSRASSTRNTSGYGRTNPPISLNAHAPQGRCIRLFSLSASMICSNIQDNKNADAHKEIQGKGWRNFMRQKISDYMHYIWYSLLLTTE